MIDGRTCEQMYVAAQPRPCMAIEITVNTALVEILLLVHPYSLRVVKEIVGLQDLIFEIDSIKIVQFLWV